MQKVYTSIYLSTIANSTSHCPLINVGDGSCNSYVHIFFVIPLFYEIKQLKKDIILYTDGISSISAWYTR
jgi:hypothetical protein